MNPKQLMTKSLRSSPYGERVARVMAAGLDAVDPVTAVKRHMQKSGSQLTIGKRNYDIGDFERVLLGGFGKASIPMAQAVVEILGDDLTQGIIITKSSTGNKIPGVKIYVGNHPIPDSQNLRATQKVVELLSKATAKDLIICLISGGGSALLTLPVENISLKDIRILTKLLLECGATINEINCLRKHISQVKGGQLARIAAPAQVAALILSDVVGDPLDVIASGPTVPDPTTYDEAVAILQKYGIDSQIPIAIKEHLRHGSVGDYQETPKVGDPIFERIDNTIVGNNYLAANAAIEQAKAEGFNALLLTTSLQGEARQIGLMMGAIAKQVTLSGDPIPRPACIIAGGETTVTITGDGLGGRNQEVALATVPEIAGLSDVVLITLATDGEDGPTDAAGACVTGETLSHAALSGLNPSGFLIRNASYEFFDHLGDLLKIGPTRTNVNDLTFLFAF